MKDSKNLVIGMLCAVICVMAVAYAAFSTTLKINGTAGISSSWNVAIETITCEKSPATNAPETGIVATGNKVSSTVATFEMSFVQPGDNATCTVVYKNTGSLAATLSHTVVGAEGTEAIEWTLTGTDGTQELAAETGTHTITVKATYKDVKDDNNNSVSSNGEKATLTIASKAEQKLS